MTTIKGLLHEDNFAFVQQPLFDVPKCQCV